MHTEILQFRSLCLANGIHAMSFLAVLCCVESGDSCRKIAEILGMAHSTVHRAVRGLGDLGLVEATPLPCNRGASKTKLMVVLSAKGEELLRRLNEMLVMVQFESRRPRWHAPPQKKLEERADRP